MARTASKAPRHDPEHLAARLDHLRSLASELRLAEDRERKRLAADLHDHLIQFLILGRMKLGLLAGHLTTPESIAAFNDVKQYVDDALTCARTMMTDLRPVLLGDADDVASAIAWVVEQLQRQGLSVTVEDEGGRKRLDEEMLVAAYQSLHELLTNILKHARTKEALLQVRRSDDCLELCVKDRGRGFDVSRIQNSKRAGGFGLLGIRERVGQLGGRFEILSTPREGTTVQLHLPLKKRGRRPTS